MFLRSAVILSVLGVVLSDNSGYGAPAAAQSGYGAPSSGYGAPSSGYDAGATSYDYSGYDSYAVEDGGDAFDLGKLEELLPLFLAVLAAIILAQLLSPLLSQLLVVLVGILPMALNIKAPIVNAILAPFSLTLCDPAGPTQFPTAGRSFEEYGLSPETAKVLSDTFSTVLEAVKDQYS